MLNAVAVAFADPAPNYARNWRLPALPTKLDARFGLLGMPRHVLRGTGPSGLIIRADSGQALTGPRSM
jgi:hypothetical protein